MKNSIKTQFAIAIMALLFGGQVSAQINWAYANNYGATRNDAARGNAVERNGDYYVTGYFTDSIKFGGIKLYSAGGSDIFIAKFKTGGGAVWAVRAGSVNNDEGASVTIASGDTLYVTGFYSGSTTGNFAVGLVGAGRDVFVHKMRKSDGAPIATARAGSNGDDEGKSIVYNKKVNAIYLTGYHANGCTFSGATFGGLGSAGSSDIFAAGISTKMTWLWANPDGGVGTDEGHSICVNDSGELFTTGFFSSNIVVDGMALPRLYVGGRDMYVFKYVPTTGVVSYIYNAGSTANDEGNGISSSPARAVYVTGYHSNNCNFGGGGLPANSLDIFVLSLSNILAYTAGVSNTGVGANPDAGQSITYDLWCNTIYVGGYAGNTCNFGGGARALVGQAGFVARYTTALAIVWDRTTDGAGNEQTLAVASNGSSNITSAGFMCSAPAAFTSATAPTINLNSLGGSDVWCGEVATGAGCAGGGSAAPEQYNSMQTSIALTSEIKIYPNPTVDILNIVTDEPINSVVLTDLQGRAVMTINPHTPQHTLSISHLPAGIYLLLVMTDNHTDLTKVMKQ
ncbi:MAG: T9SS type A sorting domain-containing protein [Flavobacteriaceae bacterium]|nr:T9SS type A sorting domain-containing protein [Flavobacteriaceae bacterium]